MPGRAFRAPNVSWTTNPVSFGADPSGLSDSLPAINAAINATIPGGECVLPNGVFNCVQDSNSSLAQSIFMKPGVRLRGQGPGLTYLKRNFQGSALVAAVRAPESAISDLTILNNGYRTGLTFPAAAAWRLASANYNYGTFHYEGWQNFYEELWTSTGLYSTPRDQDCAIFVGGSTGVTIDNVYFDSEYNDERGWWFNCILAVANEDQTKTRQLTVQDCHFSKARYGVISPGVDDSVFDGLVWESSWSYAGAPPAHLVYISGTPGNATAAEFYLSDSITIQNCVDQRTILSPVYSAAPDYYHDCSIKVRKTQNLLIQDCRCIAPQAGFNLYDIKDGLMKDCWFDASSTPEMAGAAWRSTPLFLVDQTRVPTTGYTAADYILGPMDMQNVTFISPPPGTWDASWTCWWRSNPYKTSGGNAPASIGDQWTDVSLYIASTPTSVAGVQQNQLVGGSGSYGTSQAPLRFFRHPAGGNWSDDQQLLLLDVNSNANSIVMEVEAPTGSFTAGHPPKAVSQSAITTTLNGSNFNSGATVQFNNTTATPDPNDPPNE